jgi:hypothetical protein
MIVLTDFLLAGAVATAGALGFGFYTLSTGGSSLNNARGMAMRVYAQGATVFGILGLFVWTGKVRTNFFFVA